MIDQATVDRIVDAAQIVDVVSEFVTLRKRGVNYVGLCPFHNEKTPSFSVSPAKGLCKCFSCGKGGNSIHFIMEHEQLSYYEALKYLAKKYNIEIKERELTNEEKQVQSIRESMFIVNQYARDYFQEILKNHIDGRSIGMAYFRQRGFRDDIIDKFQLGFSIDERDAFAQESLRKGYKKEFLLKTGLCYETEDSKLRDRFRGRVIFPVHTLSGKVVAFGGRILSTENKKLAKYVNSPESEIYHKSSELYGIYFAKQSIVKQDRCFLVEGYTDVISMHQSGIENVVSSSGTSLTPGQIRLIHRFTNNITVLYDGDMAGIKASIRGIDMLLEEGMNIKVVLLPDGDDPDSFARKHNATDFQAYIAAHEVDFIRFKINLLMEDAQKDPIKQAALISDIVKSISVVPESIMRDVYTRESARQLKVEEKLLVREVAKMLASQQDKANRPVAVDTNPGPEIPGAEQLPMPSPDAYESLIPQEGTEKQEFYKFERLILQMAIRYGERIICSLPDEEGNEVPTSVIQYIADDLKADEISLHHPLHIKIFNEAVNQVQKEGFVAERFFTSYPDPEIARFSTELASERYQLSNIHSKTQKILSEEERLLEIVPMLLINYKGAIIRTEIKYISSALQDPAVYNDVEKCQGILKRYKELHEILRVIEKQEGDRVILLL